MRSKLIYVTEDGLTFDDKEMALAHEREIPLREALAALWLDIVATDRLTEDDMGNLVIMTTEDFINVMMGREKEILAIFQDIK